MMPSRGFNRHLIKRSNRLVLLINVTLVVKFSTYLGYRKVASSNTSRLEAHEGFFRLLMEGIFDPYAL